MNDTIWTIIAAALLIILMVGNRKVRLISVCLLLYSEEDTGAVRKGAEQYSAQPSEADPRL